MLHASRFRVLHALAGGFALAVPVLAQAALVQVQVQARVSPNTIGAFDPPFAQFTPATLTLIVDTAAVDADGSTNVGNFTGAMQNAIFVMGGATLTASGGSVTIVNRDFRFTDFMQFNVASSNVTSATGFGAFTPVSLFFSGASNGATLSSESLPAALEPATFAQFVAPNDMRVRLATGEEIVLWIDAQSVTPVPGPGGGAGAVLFVAALARRPSRRATRV